MSLHRSVHRALATLPLALALASPVAAGTVIILHVDTGTTIGEPRVASVPADGRTWALGRVGGRGPFQPTVPLLTDPPTTAARRLAAYTLAIGDGRITGSAGCVAFSGSAREDGARVVVSDLRTDDGACAGTLSRSDPGAAIDPGRFLAAIGGAATTQVQPTDLGPSFVWWPSDPASPPLAFIPADLPSDPLDGTAWILRPREHAGEEPADVVTLRFAGGSVSGRSACGTFAATYAITAHRTVPGGALSVRRPEIDPSPCDTAPDATLREVLDALDAATSWRIEWEGDPVLTIASVGDVVLRLGPADDLDVQAPEGSPASLRLRVPFWTNDETMELAVIAGDLVCRRGACEGARIPAGSIRMLPKDGHPGGSLDGFRTFETLTCCTGSSDPSWASLVLEVDPGTVPSGRYTGSLELAVLDPTALPGEAPGWSDLPKGAIRPYGAPDGGRHVRTRVTVVVP